MQSTQWLRQPETVAAARSSAIADAAAFRGLCAGLPGADVIGALPADEVSHFWLGYRLTASICALILLVELAALAGLEVRRDPGVLFHALPNLHAGNR